MPGTASISGLISGLKTDEIISKLMELERAPVNRMRAQQATCTAKLTAWQDANTRLLALKVKALSLSSGTAFGARSVSVSDDSAVAATVAGGADISSYTVYINKLAQTHQLGTQGYADSDTTTVGTGTLTITVGDDDPVVITVDSTNNTLNLLKNAINNSGADVRASIVNTGVGDTPYKLLLTSGQSGAEREITLDVNLSGGTTPTFSEVQAAQDAEIQIGSGAGAITLHSATNKVQNALSGLTLDLKEADPAKPVTLTVAQDNDAIKQTIVDFAEQYNNFVDFVKTQFTYDTETKTGGTLFGDFRLQSIHSDLRSILSSPVSGLSQTLRTLSAVGILGDANDKLIVNSNEITEALEDNIGQVKHLFAVMGDCSSPQVSYVGCTAATKPSSADGYAINITQAATQSRLTAGVEQTEALARKETLLINGVAVAMQSGWTQTQVIQAINAKTSEHGVIASATGEDGTGTGNYLTLRQATYGSSAHITVLGSTTNGGETPVYNTTGFGFTEVKDSLPVGEGGLGTGGVGEDVAGTINGEAATGSGQILIGNEDNENTEGLRLRITATSPGDLGVIVFTKGVSKQLDEQLAFLTDSKGTLQVAQDTINDQIEALQDDIDDYEARLSVREERLYRQFAAMEDALAKLQSQGTWLTSQLETLSANWQRK